MVYGGGVIFLRWLGSQEFQLLFDVIEDLFGDAAFFAVFERIVGAFAGGGLLFVFFYLQIQLSALDLEPWVRDEILRGM